MQIREGKYGPLFDPDDTAGGGDGSSSAASDGGAAEGKASNPLADFLDEEGNLVLTVDGEEKKLGPAELKAELQKGLSGNARLREAAAAESRVQYATDVEAALDDDEEAYFRVAEARGVSEKDAADILDYYSSGAGEEAAEGEEEVPAEPAAAATKVQYVERPVSPEDQRTMDWAHAKQLDETRDWIHHNLDEGLDSDPRFGTLMKMGGRRAEQMRTLARNAVKRIVVSEQAEYTPEMRGRVLDELNDALEVFGVTGSDSLPPGAGPAPSGRAPELTHAPRVRQRPDIDSPEYEKYVTGELVALQAEAFSAG